MVRLIVYTDDPLHSIAFGHLLRECNDVSLMSVVSDLRSLRQAVSLHKPQVILLAVDQGVDWGLLGALRDDFDAAKTILWVHDITPESAYQAMEWGVRGILRRNLPPEMILKCIRKVSEGELWFEKGLTQTFMSGRAVKLSTRQRQLVTLVSQGLKNKEIATVMSITEGTVKVYLSRLFEKLGAKDRLELALLGLRNAQSSVTPMQRGCDGRALTSMFIPSVEAGETPRKVTENRTVAYFAARSGGH